MSKLHLVFGGRVKDPRGLDFVDLDNIDFVGLFQNYAEAEEAWRVLTPVLSAWSEDLVPLEEYPAGSDGP